MALSFLKFFRPWKNNYEAYLCFLVGKKNIFWSILTLSVGWETLLAKLLQSFPARSNKNLREAISICWLLYWTSKKTFSAASFSIEIFFSRNRFPWSEINYIKGLFYHLQLYFLHLYCQISGINFVSQAPYIIFKEKIKPSELWPRISFEKQISFGKKIGFH